jgi:hypothetical protein
MLRHKLPHPQKAIIMRTLRVVAMAAGLSLACLACRDVFAITLLFKVSPHTEGPFAISAKPVHEGAALKFSVALDLSQVNTLPDDSNLTIRRAATLRVEGADGVAIQCRVEPTIEKGIATYRVTLANDLVAHARLAVSETKEDQNAAGMPRLPGGGLIYEIHLDEFTPAALEASRPTINAYLNGLARSRRAK